MGSERLSLRSGVKGSGVPGEWERGGVEVGVGMRGGGGRGGRRKRIEEGGFGTSEVRIGNW